MSQFIETIKVQYGKLYNMSYHDARANQARREVLTAGTVLDLSASISIPDELGRGLYKCRVQFGDEITNIAFERYRRQRIRSLKLVESNNIAYPYKYADRTDLDRLFEKRAQCDDVLIVRQDLITDTSYANVAFYNGTEWLTPAHPLLPGTKRQELLDRRLIRAERIRMQDLSRFTHCVIFNALRGFDIRNAIPLRKIVS